MDEFCPDTETLRYTRDLLFHITRRRRGIKKSISLVERKASEHVRSKLIGDLVGEGTKCNFPSHLVRISEGYREHVELDSESVAFNEIKQKISKEFETKFDELQGEIKDMQRNMRDVIKRMNDSVAILDSDVTPSHGNSTNTFGASRGNVGLNESIGNVINDDMAKESNVEFTEGSKTMSVRRDLEQVNVRPKVVLYVGDSMFHGLDKARMKVQNIRAIKQAKSEEHSERRLRKNEEVCAR